MAFVTLPSPLAVSSPRGTSASCSAFAASSFTRVAVRSRSRSSVRPAPSVKHENRPSMSARTERTYIMAKPDATNRGLVGKIVSKFETKGYKLCGTKMVVPTKDMAEEHYEALKEKPFFNDLVSFLCSGPVVCLCFQGTEVVDTGRKLIGATNPRASDPSTLRGEFGLDVGRNVVHGSDSVESAERELALWFKPEEIVDWTPTMDTWIYE